jgi:serine/threonine protein phosphatase 1
VINELLTIKNIIPIMGNHDFWCYNWMRYGWRPDIWVQQGGQATLDSYKFKGLEERPEKEYLALIEEHKTKYFDKCYGYYIDEHKNAYVHGGYADINGLGNDRLDTYMWDRDLWNKAKSAKDVQLNLTKMYQKVFIGHTSMGFGSVPTKKGGNVINCDTGGGWEGALSLINVDTEEVFQSDQVKLLYPEIKGR